MSEFKYLKASRLYNELYYQYPKVFIESDTYKKLSEGAKIAYMLLKAKSEFAVLRHQIDQDGNLYFEFTGKEMAEMMNCSERRISTIKKELEEFNLLKQVHMGFNKKTGKNEKNRLYLAELEVSDKDVYLMQQREKNTKTIDNSGLANSATRSEKSRTPKTVDNSGLANSAIRSEFAGIIDNSGLANSAQELNNSLDTSKTPKDTDEKIRQQDSILLDGFVDLMKDSSIDSFVPEKVLKAIATFSETFAEAQAAVRAIHNAKRSAQDRNGTSIIYELIQDQLGIAADQKLYSTILKAYQKQKTEKVKNMENVIFIYTRNWFEEEVIPAIKFYQSQLETKNE